MKSKTAVLYGIFCFHWIELICLFYCTITRINKIKKNFISIPLRIIFIIFIYSFITSYILGYNQTKLFQQTFFFIIFTFLYATFFTAQEKKLDDLFKKYLKASYVISLLGLIQVIFFFFFDIDIFSHFTTLGYLQCISHRIIRLRSICPEAGSLGTILAPAVFYIIYFKDKWGIVGPQKWIILAACLFSTSMTFVVTVLFALYFRFLSKNKKFDIITIIICLIWGSTLITYASQKKYEQNISYANAKGIKMRLIETSSLLLSLDNLEEMEKSNASTYAWMTNLYVSRHAPFRLTGTGLGSHKQNYLRTYQNASVYNYGLNADDGYSLLNRIYSEFGLLGLALYLFFIFRRLDRKDVISFSLLFYLVSAFLRGGNYFANGCIFFHYFFFIAKNQYFESLKNSTIKNQDLQK